MANLKSGDDYVFYNWYSGERPVSAPPPHTLETGTAVRDPSPPPPTPHACYEGRGTRFNAPCPSAEAEALTSMRLKAVRTESPFPHDPLKTECTEYDCSGVVDPRTPLESGVWLSGSRAHQALFCPVLFWSALFCSGLVCPDKPCSALGLGLGRRQGQHAGGGREARGGLRGPHLRRRDACAGRLGLRGRAQQVRHRREPALHGRVGPSTKHSPCRFDSTRLGPSLPLSLPSAQHSSAQGGGCCGALRSRLAAARSIAGVEQNTPSNTLQRALARTFTALLPTKS